MAKGVPRGQQLEAAHGRLPLPTRELLTALLFLCHSGDMEIRAAAIATGRRLPAQQLAEVVQSADCHPQLLTLLAQLRHGDALLAKALLAHPALPAAALHFLAARVSHEALSDLLQHQKRIAEDAELKTALLGNPHLDQAQRAALLPAGPEPAATSPATEAHTEPNAETDATDVDAEEQAEPEEEVNQSKYQKALEMEVSAKIKMALTGDKEWRTIFIKDPNKLVHGAVLKNPRITEGEVLALAKNKASSDEMIRIILLNREWMKNYSIKAALVSHPKTPTATALRFIGVLGEKELKSLAKSKGVSQVVVNSARRMLTEKQKKR